jgi:hypothetical protein
MGNHSSHTRPRQRDRLLSEPTIRQSKRQRILTLLAQNLGKRYESRNLHGIFGTSFRTRVSEINRDPASPIRIANETMSTDEGETSVYWSEPRQAESLFGSLAPERRHRDDG